MSLQAVLERVEFLAKAAEQSLANHNALMGRLAEAKELADVLKAVPGPIGEAAAAAEAVVEPVVAAAGDVIEGISHG